MCIARPILPLNLKYKTLQTLYVTCFLFRIAVVFAQSKEAMCSVQDEDIVGAAPTGYALITSEWSTIISITKVRPTLYVSRYIWKYRKWNEIHWLGSLLWHDILQCTIEALSLFIVQDYVILYIIIYIYIIDKWVYCSFHASIIHVMVSAKENIRCNFHQQKWKFRCLQCYYIQRLMSICLQ